MVNQKKLPCKKLFQNSLYAIAKYSSSSFKVPLPPTYHSHVVCRERSTQEAPTGANCNMNFDNGMPFGYFLGK